MIERELRQIVEGKPAHAHRVGGRADAVIRELREREVRDRDHAIARIAIERAERVELLEVDVLDARFFFELAARGLVERLFDAHEATRQRPRMLERLQLALDQEDLQVTLVDAEDDTVHRERGARVRVAKGHAFSAT